MKIVSLETKVVKIPLKTPFITALRRVEDAEFVRVSIHCDNGSVGVGEAPATKAITGEGIEEILGSVESAANSLKGSFVLDALERIHKNIDNGTTIGSSARAALDMALVSIITKSQDISLYQFLGAEKPCKLKTDVTISLNEPKKMLEDAREACQNGMHILKVKLGKDIEHAIDITKALNNEFPQARLLIDANQAWDEKQTKIYIDEVESLDIELIEQPVIAEDIKALKNITDYSNIPILADEAVFTLEDAKRVIDTKSAHMINIKLMKCGGVTTAVEILEFCRAHNVKCMLGSMIEGPHSINAALHIAMAYSDVIKYVDLDSPLLYKEMPNELEFEFKGCEITYNK